MKTGAKQIIGKTITGVIIKEGKHLHPPCSLLYLTFSDNTCYEFYSEDGYIQTTSEPFVIKSEEELLDQMDHRMQVMFNTRAKK